MKCRKCGVNGLDGTILHVTVSDYYRRKSGHSWSLATFHARKNNNSKTLR